MEELITMKTKSQLVAINYARLKEYDGYKVFVSFEDGQFIVKCSKIINVLDIKGYSY